MFTIILLLIKIPLIFSIWPVPYTINLSDNETFVIFDTIEKSEVEDVYEDEMIKEDEMKMLNVDSPDEKFYRIHRSVNNNTKNDYGEVVRKNRAYEELNPDLEYSPPFKAGVVDENGQFISDDHVIYFDDDESDSGTQKFKRDEQTNATKEEYDYNVLKDQFNAEVEKAAVSNDTANYTNVKEDETPKESIKAIFEIKEPKNCTEEERKGIGLGAVKCLIYDLYQPKLKNAVVDKLIKIVVIWLLVYLIIAIPLWCQYGWCCCCFRCKFCRPHEQIEEVKRFFAQNPPGTYHDADGNVIKYKPTRYEKYAQKALEKQLRNL